jgi:hypothetical protein
MLGLIIALNQKLLNNINKTLNNYTDHLSRLIELKKNAVKIEIDNFVNYDSSRIAWTLALKNNLT